MVHHLLSAVSSGSASRARYEGAEPTRTGGLDRHSAITTVLDLTNGDVRTAQRFSRLLDVRTLLLYDDNREDLSGKMARLVAAAL